MGFEIRRRDGRHTAHAFAAAGVLALLASTARADTVFIVNTTQDAVDANPGDGVCDTDTETPGEQCSLRAAIQEANALGGAVTILVPPGVYRLTRRGAGESAGATGDLDVSTQITITRPEGTSGDIVVDGRKAKDRVFDVTGSLRLVGVTVTNGKAPRGESGGGIRCTGFLALEGCRVERCKSKDDAGGVDVDGGTATFSGCEFSRNKSRDDGAGVDVDSGEVAAEECLFLSNRSGDEGGGLESSGGVVTLTACSFEKNKAKFEGGALSLEDGAVTTIDGCEFVSNRAKKAGALSVGDDSFGQNVTFVSGSTFTKNRKGSCDEDVDDGGGNTFDDDSCGLSSADL